MERTGEVGSSGGRGCGHALGGEEVAEGRSRGRGRATRLCWTGGAARPAAGDVRPRVGTDALLCSFFFFTIQGWRGGTGGVEGGGVWQERAPYSTWTEKPHALSSEGKCGPPRMRASDGGGPAGGGGAVEGAGLGRCWGGPWSSERRVSAARSGRRLITSGEPPGMRRWIVEAVPA